jgi:hypothetical protein
MENLTYGSFEVDWKRLDVKKKKDLVLEGLYRGACAAPRDNSRVSCAEMTIEGLVGDGEYNLIRLVRICLAIYIRSRVPRSSNVSLPTIPLLLFAVKGLLYSFIPTSSTEVEPVTHVLQL